MEMKLPVYRAPPPAFGIPSRTQLAASRVGAFASGRTALRAEAGGAKQDVQKSSVGQSTVNLVKNVVGAGMLSLPSGVAAFSGSPQALLPAVVVTLMLAIVSAYGFVLIAEACKRTGENTYQGAWGKAVSQSTMWIPSAACTMKAAIGCVSFSMILGDCLSLIFGALGSPVSRSTVILGLTTSVLFPLCSMKSLAPLAKFSVAGVLSNVYICGFILMRYLDGSYVQGPLARAAPALPKFAAGPAAGAWSLIFDPGFTVLLSILATAYLAHYNAPNFFEQLAPGPDGTKDRRFLVVSVMGFALSALIFSVVMCGGFLTFGKSSLGLILNNYAATDRFAMLARCAIAVSLLTAYPIVFYSLRKQFVALLGKTGEQLATESPRALTIGLLSTVTMVALNVRNLGKLAAFTGAIFGSFLIYVGPALMMIGLRLRGIGPKGSGLGRLAQFVMVPMGICFGALGAAQSLK